MACLGIGIDRRRWLIKWLEGENPHNKEFATVAVTAMLTLLGSQDVSFAQSGPFTKLAGAWTGGGAVFSDNRSTEGIRCKANRVDEAGVALQETLRCASDSYRFDIESNAMSRAGHIFWKLDRSEPEHLGTSRRSCRRRSNCSLGRSSRLQREPSHRDARKDAVGLD